VVVCVLGTLALAGRASAAEPTPGRPLVDIVQVGGLLDPVNIALVDRVLDDVDRGGRTSLVVLQLDSSDASASEKEVRLLAARFRLTRVPVAVWVGPTGKGKATGVPFRLLEHADVVGVAPGTEVGAPGGVILTVNEDRQPARPVGSKEAVRRGIAAIESPTLADFIGRLDGRQAKGRTIATARARVEGEPFVLSSEIDIRFRKPGLVDRTLHALGSPSATYFLVVSGLLLFLFELYSAGVGIAAASAAVCLALSSYGLGTLGVRPLGLALLLLATFGFGVDIQSGEPRAWTGIGAIALAAGSATLFDGRRPSWLALVLVIGGALLLVLFGIPSTVRTRFSTPTIGREDLIGAAGVAVTAIAPEGTVQVRGAPWRARTFPAAIPAGAAVQVVAIEDLVLDVMPAGTELLPPRHAPRLPAPPEG
jgi:membrane-bound serine protease (ClpP class)